MPTAGIYISAADYETFGKHLPPDCKTVTQFASQELHRIAEKIRNKEVIVA